MTGDNSESEVELAFVGMVIGPRGEGEAKPEKSNEEASSVEPVSSVVEQSE